VAVLNFASSTLLDNAAYQIGQTYYDGDDYAKFGQARDEYQIVLDDAIYPTSVFKENAQFYIALTFHDQNNCGNEKLAMQTVISDFSQSFFVLPAQDHISRIETGEDPGRPCQVKIQ